MQLVLQARKGPLAGRQFVLRQGQVATVGRTEYADFSVPGDAAMSAVHFSLSVRGQGSYIRDLDSSNGTMVNGEKVSERRLRTGDEIAAGRTTFAVVIETDSQLTPTESDESAAELEMIKTSLTEIRPVTSSALFLCEGLELSEPAREVLSAELSPAEFVEALAEESLFADAVRFLAFWLPKPTAVAWGCDCVAASFGDSIEPRDAEVLELARKWAADPGEEQRRAAGAAGETNPLEKAASWMALAAGWSGGSLAPPELPEVPPDGALTASAVTCALILAAVHGDPNRVEERYRGFLQSGMALTSTSPN